MSKIQKEEKIKCAKNQNDKQKSLFYVINFIGYGIHGFTIVFTSFSNASLRLKTDIPRKSPT